MEKKSFTFEEIKLKLVKYCTYQDRCHAEVEQKMWEFLLISEAKEELMLYLIQENFLNEERYTRSYIRGKFYIKNWGRKKIFFALKKRNISEKLINKCFDEIDDQDYIDTLGKVAQNYYNKLNNLKIYQKKNKTINYLINKGYEFDLIIDYFNQHP